MKVFCSYDVRYDAFLKAVVKLTIDKYGSQLNINALEEIELVNKRKYNYITDGKAYIGRIEVTSRLYELLPTLDIEELEDNNEYKLLRKTLYHELGHINDMTLMPKLYGMMFKDFQNGDVSLYSISILLWIEYVAERRTAGFENVNDMELCDDFVNEKWECSKFEPCLSGNSENFYDLTKLLPYFIARTTNEDIRNQYLDQIENRLVVDYIKEIAIELKYLESKGTFDDPEVLKRVYEIIDKYFNVFMSRYAKEIS